MKTKITTLLVLLLAMGNLQTHAQWSLTGNANATATSVLGTTNAIPLRLFTKNTARVVIDTLGRVGVGTTTPINLLTVKGAGSTPVAAWANAGAPLFVGFGEQTVGNADYILSMASTLSNARPVFIGRRSKGTLAAPATVAANDNVMSFLASAYDGTSFQNPAAIDFYVDGTPTAGNVPARISFVTGTNSTTRAERLKIGSNGDVSVTAGNLLLAKKANIKGIVGVNGDTLSGTALMVNANATNDGIRVADPVNKYVLYAAKSGINQGIYVTKSSTTSTNGSITGVGTKASIGVEGYGSKGNGVYAQSDSAQALYATSNTSIGVFGQTNNGLSYAGYFNGDVYGTNYYQSSDARFKSNISEFGNAMQIINTLKPYNYTFKREGEYALLQLPQGTHYGLLAQDVEQVLPNLVKETQVSIKDKRPGDGLETDGAAQVHNISFKGVNYTELIPVMIKAMQELLIKNEELRIKNDSKDERIDNLQQQIDELKAMIKGMATGERSSQSVTLTAAVLKQNIPNPPVGNATTIQYTVPKGASKAQMLITDISGKTIRQITLGTGKGTLNLNTQNLASGTYNYTLMVDGKMTETKKMLVNK